jgi:hypothetical protein
MPLVPARDLSDESDDPNDPDYSEGTEDDSNDAGDPNPRPRTRQRTNSASAATDLVTTADADGDLDIFTIFAVNDIIEELQGRTSGNVRALTDSARAAVGAIIQELRNKSREAKNARDACGQVR